MVIATETQQALKALALVRTQKVEESLVLCDEVLASKTTDDATLSAMMHVLRGLGRRRSTWRLKYLTVLTCTVDRQRHDHHVRGSL